MQLSLYFFMIYIIFISALLTSCGGTEETQPESLIFSNVEAIDLIGPENGSTINSGDSFTFYIPGGVSVAVLGIFDDGIETSGNTIVNIEDFRAGSRTGLTGWTTSKVSAGELYEFNGVNDFNEALPFDEPGPYSWAVWGFDKYGELTHASPQWQVDITY